MVSLAYSTFGSFNWNSIHDRFLKSILLPSIILITEKIHGAKKELTERGSDLAGRLMGELGPSMLVCVVIKVLLYTLQGYLALSNKCWEGAQKRNCQEREIPPES